MKFHPRIRQLTRNAIGLGKSESISPEDLHALAARENVLVLSIGHYFMPSIDPRLPGEQRAVMLRDLAATVDGVPKDRPIITTCG